MGPDIIAAFRHCQYLVVHLVGVGGTWAHVLLPDILQLLHVLGQKNMQLNDERHQVCLAGYLNH